MQKQKIVQKIDPDILQFLKVRKEVPVNTMIILINIVVFFLTELTGSSLDGKHLVEWGAAYTPLIQEGHEYYRFFTCMFLHAGLLHLASNSIYLYYFGVRAERLLGTGKFLVLYLVSGLCGGVFSVLFSGNAGVSIGASGAIYGLLGAMLLLTKKRGARYTGMNYSTMLLLAATAIGFGFLQEGVDNFAHIGGFLGGIAVFSLLLRKK